jgi:alpha-beta hydrolase superfamily lysophospholipase
VWQILASSITHQQERETMTPASPHFLRFRPALLLRMVLLVCVGIASLLAGLLLVPVSGKALASHSRPASSYDEALQRLQAVQAEEAPDLNPLCLTRALIHGQRTERVLVLMHGFTNCPNQYKELSRQLFTAGYNVLMPCLPRHGMADRLTEEPVKLTAEEMIALTDDSVDIARGLGEEVILVGFSTGGVLAASMAEQRSDVNAALLISPFFAPQAIPQPVTPLVVRLLARLPNFWQWWDPEKREDVAGPQHAYPRLSSRALAQILRLSLNVQKRATAAAPLTPNLLVVTNANDESVDNRATYQVVDLWRKQGATVQTYEFPERLGLLHDLLDPDQPYQQIDVVYPVLLNLLEDLVE